MGSSADFSDVSSDDHNSDDDDFGWIPWFCSLKGNEFFCEVDDAFVQDTFNLTGLDRFVPYFERALDMILDIEPSPDDNLSEEQQEMIETDAENLYGLIHARFILTSRGLHAMLEKFRHVHFGRCPRVLCRGQSVLPVGLSDTVNQESVKVYCPRCEEVYQPKNSRYEHIDGAYFGTTFPHLFFLTFPELKPSKSTDGYTPRVFGFRIHKTAYKRSLEARKQSGEGGAGAADSGPAPLEEMAEAAAAGAAGAENGRRPAGAGAAARPSGVFDV